MSGRALLQGILFVDRGQGRHVGQQGEDATFWECTPCSHERACRLLHQMHACSSAQHGCTAPRTHGHEVGDVVGRPLSAGLHAKRDTQGIGGGACSREGA